MRFMDRNRKKGEEGEFFFDSIRNLGQPFVCGGTHSFLSSDFRFSALLMLLFLFRRDFLSFDQNELQV